MPDRADYLREAAFAADAWRSQRDELAAVLAASVAAGASAGQLARATRLEVGDVIALAAEHRAIFAGV
jgi:hypothetical protein